MSEIYDTNLAFKTCLRSMVGQFWPILLHFPPYEQDAFKVQPPAKW